LIGDVSEPATFLDDWLARVHPDDRDRAVAVIRSAMDDEVPIWWHEYRLRDSDGRYRSVLDRGHTAKTPGGQRRVIGALLDVTPVHEAERLRAAAEAKFRWLVERSVVAVYMMSGGRFTYINDTGAQMLGYMPEELTALDLTELLDGDDDPADVFGGGPNVARIRRRDGTLLHVAFYPNEVTIDGERIIVGTGADITDSVRTRQALEASEQRYRQLVEDVTEILYTLDPEGRITSLSPSFERITEYPVADWIGRPFSDLFQPHEATQHSAADQRRAIRDYELPTRSGAVAIVEVSSEPRYIDGVVSGTIGMARDVTEHRNIVRKLEEAKRMSSLGQLAASLAHEFNNVLMGIQPFVEVIRRNLAAGGNVNDALDHISSAISRGKRASQEILRFSHPKPPQLSAIDPREWLLRFLTQLAATLPPSVHFSSSLAPDVPFIRGDREHLELVITNLVFNARDAINGDGAIHVAAAREDDVVSITVSDTGCGIAPHMLDRIFEPLFTTKRNGTGLGLAIARRLMEGQGGSLDAANRHEGGSVFRVTVRTAQSAAVSACPPRHELPCVERILLVEDDPTVGTGLEALLTSYGYQPTWVRAAGEVCDAARRTRPQVAIIDVNLPDGNGVDLVPILREEHHDLPIVLSTGHVEMNISGKQRRILSLMKPYEFSDLLRAIGNVTAA
jgi:PAS domain S-box-containing protein